MPPKSMRRLRIADAAIEVLARAGARGLSHRAVDEAAAVPAGTTSNYFRTRKALLDAVATRLLDHQLAEVDERPEPANLDELVAQISAMVRARDGHVRARYLARIELFLEATRDPELLPSLVKVREAIIAAFARLIETAGFHSSPERLHAAGSMFNGLLFDHLVFADTQWKAETVVRDLLATLITEEGKP